MTTSNQTKKITKNVKNVVYTPKNIVKNVIIHLQNIVKNVVGDYVKKKNRALFRDMEK